MLDPLKRNHILTELLWEPTDLSQREPAVQALFRGMVKGNRKLQYRDAEGKPALGYCNKSSTLYEPFAVYIKEL